MFYGNESGNRYIYALYTKTTVKVMWNLRDLGKPFAAFFIKYVYKHFKKLISQ